MDMSHREKPLEQRQADSKKIIDKFPDKVCVYVERSEKCNTVPDIDKHKFLVPGALSIGQFIFVIRKRVKLAPEIGLFFYANNTILSGTTSMNNIYDKYKADDNFLYITYSGENCFGAIIHRPIPRISFHRARTLPMPIWQQAENLGVGETTYRTFVEMQGRDLQPTDYDSLLRLQVTDNKKTLHPIIISGFSTLSSNEIPDDDCSICLCSMKDSEARLVRIPCNAGHIFHLACIKEWLTTSSTCCPLDNNDLCESVEA